MESNNLDVRDRSNYFKGMLILAIKDNVIVEQEEKMLMELGKKLGFEKKFCHNAIQQSLGNEYLVQTPPVFSSRKLAEHFLRDGVKLAISDNNLDPYELQWLNSVAKSNAIEKTWLSNNLEEFINTKSDDNRYSLLENMAAAKSEADSAMNMNMNRQIPI